MADTKSPAVRLIERHNYSISSVPGFLSGRPPEALENRARAILTESFPLVPPHLLCVLYDKAFPDMSIGDSYMLIGPEPEALATECIAHLELEA